MWLMVSLSDLGNTIVSGLDKPVFDHRCATHWCSEREHVTFLSEGQLHCVDF